MTVKRYYGCSKNIPSIFLTFFLPDYNTIMIFDNIYKKICLVLDDSKQDLPVNLGLFIALQSYDLLPMI